MYSKLSKIPLGRAKGELIDGCLVLEGGALRGVYTSGVLDCLMQNNILFRCVIGVSAGALNGLCYTAGNIGVAARLNLLHRDDKSYISFKELPHKNLINFDYIFEYFKENTNFDEEAILKQKKRFVAVATSLESGEPAYFELGKCDIFKAVQASASLPFISDPVEIGEDSYLDGGCADKIPFKWAIKQDYKKIFVVRTRPYDYVKDVKRARSFLLKNTYRDHPKFALRLSSTLQAENHLAEEIKLVSKMGDLYALYPSKDIGISILEDDMEKLGDLYFQGYQDMEEKLEELKEYLKR